MGSVEKRLTYEASERRIINVVRVFPILLLASGVDVSVATRSSRREREGEEESAVKINVTLREIGFSGDNWKKCLCAHLCKHKSVSRAMKHTDRLSGFLGPINLSSQRKIQKDRQKCSFNTALGSRTRVGLFLVACFWENS